MERLSYFNKMKNNFMQRIDLLSLKFIKFFRQKKYLFFSVAVFAAIIIGLFLPRGAAHAGIPESFGGFVLDLIAPLIYLVFYVFFYIAYIVAWIGASAINMTLNPAIINSVLDMNPAMPLYQAWVIFRDVANLLFILILLLIALGTIFRAESYNIKKSLYKFILIIFLINFSGMIAGLFIDFGNFLMYGVLKMMCTSGSSQCFQDFYSQLMGVIDKLFWKYSIVGIRFDFKDAAAIGVAAIYTFVYGLVLMALAAFLLIRIAALAVLIIISPLAFFGYTAPGLAGLKNKWWDNLVQYVMFGPVFALMLYVSGLMAQNTMAVDPRIFEVNPNLSYMGQDIVMILTSIIPLIFLVAIIPVTRAFGIAGSNAVLGATVGLGVGAAVGATKWLGGAADRFMARGAQQGYPKWRRGLSYLSPGAWKRAIKAHNTESEHDYNQAAGKMREKFVQPASDYGNKSSVKYEEDQRQKDVAREAADIRDKTKDEKVHLFNECLDKEGKIKTGMAARAEALISNLAITSDVNEVYTKLKGKNGNFYENTPGGFVKFMDEKFRPVFNEEIGKEDKTGRLMAEIAQLEKKDGHYALKGTVEFENGKYKIVRNPDILEKKAAKEVENSETQKQWQNKDSRTTLDEVTVRNPDETIKMKQAKDEIGRVKKDENGNDIMIPETTWQTADRGVIEIANMTDEVIDGVWKSKPKHQKRMLEVFEREEEQFAKIDSLVDRGFISAGDGEKAKKNMRKLRENLREAVYGKPGKKKYQGGGMDVDQSGGLPQEERERREEHAREDEDEEERKRRRGPKPTSGGAEPDEVMRGTFEDIRKRAENIQFGKMPASEKRVAWDNLRSDFEKAMNMDAKDFGQDIGEGFKDIKNEEEKKTLQAMRDVDIAIKEETGKSASKENIAHIDDSFKESVSKFQAAYNEVDTFNPTLPNYSKRRSDSLKKFVNNLESKNTDKETIEFVKKVVAEDQGAMADEIRQKDRVDLSFSAGKYGKKDLGSSEQINLDKYIDSIEKGTIKIADLEESLKNIDKKITKGAGEGLSTGMFGDEYERAKKFYVVAQKAENPKEQRAYLAVATHILESIDLGLQDKGIQEVLKGSPTKL
jgi:hypothetical protein